MDNAGAGDRRCRGASGGVDVWEPESIRWLIPPTAIALRQPATATAAARLSATIRRTTSATTTGWWTAVHTVRSTAGLRTRYGVPSFHPMTHVVPLTPNRPTRGAGAGAAGSSQRRLFLKAQEQPRNGGCGAHFRWGDWKPAATAAADGIPRTQHLASTPGAAATSPLGATPTATATTAATWWLPRGWVPQTGLRP